MYFIDLKKKKKRHTNVSKTLEYQMEPAGQVVWGYLEMVVPTIVSPCWLLALHMYSPKSMVSMSSTVRMLWVTRVV